MYASVVPLFAKDTNVDSSWLINFVNRNQNNIHSLTVDDIGKTMVKVFPSFNPQNVVPDYSYCGSIYKVVGKEFIPLCKVYPINTKETEFCLLKKDNYEIFYKQYNQNWIDVKYIPDLDKLKLALNMYRKRFPELQTKGIIIVNK